MEISIYSLLEGATQATGTVAVIDVFRAFTTAAVALANGASSIVMVRSVEEASPGGRHWTLRVQALALRDAGIGQICFARRARLATRWPSMGEVRGRAWRHQPRTGNIC